MIVYEEEQNTEIGGSAAYDGCLSHKYVYHKYGGKPGTDIFDLPEEDHHERG